MMEKGVFKRPAGVGIALLFIVLAGHLTAGRAKAQGSNPGNPTILQAIQELQNSVNALQKTFYLTQDSFNGGQALTACAAPFHMASLWEILDPSNLKYDANLGYVNVDSGSGPPASILGWIRTGGPANTSGPGGAANCNAWASSSPSDSGTLVELLGVWNAAAHVAGPWNADPDPCSNTARVWCVQD